MKTVCPYCNHEYDDIPDKLRGKTVSCANCQRDFVVERFMTPEERMQLAADRARNQRELRILMKVCVWVLVFIVAAGIAIWCLRSPGKVKSIVSRLTTPAEKPSTEVAPANIQELKTELNKVLDWASTNQLGTGLEKNLKDDEMGNKALGEGAQVRRDNANEFLDKLDETFKNAGLAALGGDFRFDFEWLTVFRKADAWDTLTFLKIQDRIKAANTPDALRQTFEDVGLSAGQKQEILIRYYGEDWRKLLLTEQANQQAVLRRQLKDLLARVKSELEEARRQAFDKNRDQFAFTTYEDFITFTLRLDLSPKDRQVYEQFLKTQTQEVDVDEILWDYLQGRISSRRTLFYRLTAEQLKRRQEHKYNYRSKHKRYYYGSYHRQNYSYPELLKFAEDIQNKLADLEIFVPQNTAILTGMPLLPEASEQQKQRRIPFQQLVSHPKQKLLYEKDAKLPFTGILEFFSNGKKRLEIACLNGQPNGDFVISYDDGAVCLTGRYRNAKADGEWTLYAPPPARPSSAEKSGKDKNADAETARSNKDETTENADAGDGKPAPVHGPILTVQKFRNGQKSGESRYYRGGKLFLIENYQNDRLSGESVLFYPDGTPRQKRDYQEDSEFLTFYHANGQKSFSAMRRNSLLTPEPTGETNNKEKDTTGSSTPPVRKILFAGPIQFHLEDGTLLAEGQLRLGDGFVAVQHPEKLNPDLRKPQSIAFKRNEPQNELGRLLMARYVAEEELWKQTLRKRTEILDTQKRLQRLQLQ